MARDTPIGLEVGCCCCGCCMLAVACMCFWVVFFAWVCEWCEFFVSLSI